MSEFQKVARVEDIPDPGRELLELEDRIVVLLHVGGEFFCIDDVCTHDGGPLSDGPLDGFAIACPRHGAKFDIRTGQVLSMPATEDTVAHDVKVENGDIYIRINDGSGPMKTVSGGATVSRSGSAHDSFRPDAAVASVDAPPASAPSIPEPPPVASGELSEELIREELKKVIDPELFVNIVDLGLIYNVDLVPAEEGKSNVKIDMTMTSPMCPAGPQMIANSKQVLAQLPKVGEVEVKIVLDPPWTPDKMSEDARDQLGIF
jgi:metal-sulfur cluster biosynthetic enzyme/nitrite reductase/ring-hydroxylating ferredoxin subunit